MIFEVWMMFTNAIIALNGLTVFYIDRLRRKTDPKVEEPVDESEEKHPSEITVPRPELKRNKGCC